MLFLTNIDLSQNELRNATVQNLASAPSTPKVGQVYYDTTQNTFFGWNGSVWENLGASGGISSVAVTSPVTNSGSASAPNIGLNTVTSATPASPSNSGKVPLLDSNGSLEADTTGNAATASKLKSGATINVGGTGSDATGTAQTFDGSTGVSIPITLSTVLAGGLSSSKIYKITADAKGRITAGTAATASDLTSLLGYTPVKKYASTIGDGTNTSYTVTHNLGATDVTVQVWQTAANGYLVQPDIQISSSNAITVTFSAAPASGAYRVVVTG